MTGFSGITGTAPKRIGGTRYKVSLPSRLFMSDKVIHKSTIIALFSEGVALQFFQAVPLNTSMHLEFHLPYENEQHRIRLKGAVKYCLIRSDSGADLDLKIDYICSEDGNIYDHVLKQLANKRH